MITLPKYDAKASQVTIDWRGHTHVVDVQPGYHKLDCSWVEVMNRDDGTLGIELIGLAEDKLPTTWNGMSRIERLIIFSAVSWLIGWPILSVAWLVATIR